MTTTLYDTNTNQLIGGFRDGPYLVDGKPPILPSNIVELTVVVPSTPQYDPVTQNLQYSDFKADLVNKLWTQNITIIDKTPGEIAQYEMQQQIDSKEREFQFQISEGYQIPNTTIKLKIDDSARQAWSQLLLLINEMLTNGQITPSAELTILDKDNVPHVFTVAELKPILSNLGMYYYQLWLQRNTTVL